MTRNPLPVPSAVENDASAVEILRIWVLNGSPHVSLHANLWEDPAAWGIMLADLARHVANAYHQHTGRDRDLILNAIRRGFDAEWAFPTDNPSGSLQ